MTNPTRSRRPSDPRRRGARLGLLAAALLACLAPIMGGPALAAEKGGHFLDLNAMMATIIFEGRPSGLLTVVPSIDVDPSSSNEDFIKRRFTIQDRFILGLGAYATTGFDPRTPVDVRRVKAIFQTELDKLMGPGKGTVYITAVYIAKRQ